VPLLRIAAADGLGSALTLGSAAARNGTPAEPPAFLAYKARLSQTILARALRIHYRSQTGGLARVTFRIDAAGNVVASEIHTSSGSPYIDSLAREAVPVGAELLPIPGEFGTRAITVTVPMRFPPKYH